MAQPCIFIPPCWFLMILADLLGLLRVQKILFNFATDFDVLFAANTGLALGNKQFRIRPEIGFMTNPREQDWYMHYGVGFTSCF